MNRKIVSGVLSLVVSSGLYATDGIVCKDDLEKQQRTCDYVYRESQISYLIDISNGSEKLLKRINYSIDSKGKLKPFKYENANESYIITYDSDGDVVKKVGYKRNGTWIETNSYKDKQISMLSPVKGDRYGEYIEYYKNGQIAEKKNYGENDKLEGELLRYDEKGNITEHVIVSQGKVVKRII